MFLGIAFGGSLDKEGFLVEVLSDTREYRKNLWGIGDSSSNRFSIASVASLSRPG